MRTINEKFYRVLCALWNDDNMQKQFKSETLQNWMIMSIFFDDRNLQEELEFLTQLLNYKD